eukprot:CAMPEP_0177637602 /NCGR_PEP_ID=MMETSP0447-20121125/5055_1 /TAXON_ID=0 /ORGANISM="Stygamoeba regulata, Strain BSH-02190019" /LENGTH=568 /DNA_ID=CAMNT_0019139533 /DNA_START=40 /DNA_END=1746 /DNA_ORIENTATION=+
MALGGRVLWHWSRPMGRLAPLRPHAPVALGERRPLGMRQCHSAAHGEAGDEGQGEPGAPEGTLRHPVRWKEPGFYDQQGLDEELRRVFDVCHGCRACFDLCRSFPVLFETVDASPTGELDAVPSSQFKPVVDACTLCDMCYRTKCPYVPPHPLNIDFPHLMLRYRTVEKNSTNGGALPLAQQTPQSDPAQKQEVLEGVSRELSLRPAGTLHALMVDIDRVAPLLSRMAALFNALAATKTTPHVPSPLHPPSHEEMDAKRRGTPSAFRVLLSRIAGVHVDAELPRYVPPHKTFLQQWGAAARTPNPQGQSYGKRKVVLFGTCLANFNKPDIGMAAASLLLHFGVDVEVAFPGCCGMPQLEQGNIAAVTGKGGLIAADLVAYVARGYDVVSLVASCSLMLKKELALLDPDNPDVTTLSSNCWDICEYIVHISKQEGLTPPSKPINATVVVHHACHSRAQNVGFKSLELLRLVEGLQLVEIERCSGHGGSFGVMKETYPLALQVGRVVFKKVADQYDGLQDGAPLYVTSDCPLAADHIRQGTMALPVMKGRDAPIANHPIQVIASAYSLAN